MGATTTHGIVYKGPGESFWPANATSEEIALSIDAALSRIGGSATAAGTTLPAAPAENTARTGYPDGMSVYVVTGAPGNGWPTNGILVVRNYTTSGRSTQELTQASTGAATAPSRFIRQWGSGSAWTPWTQILASRLLFNGESATDLTAFTNTTPATGSPVVGGTFVAPYNGEVEIGVDGDLGCSGVVIGAFAYLGFQLRQGSTVGSGTIVFDVDKEARSLSIRSTSTTAAFIGSGRSYPVTGLTAGDTYNIRLMHGVTASDGTLLHRRLTVKAL